MTVTKEEVERAQADFDARISDPKVATALTLVTKMIQLVTPDEMRNLYLSLVSTIAMAGKIAIEKAGAMCVIESALIPPETRSLLFRAVAAVAADQLLAFADDPEKFAATVEQFNSFEAHLRERIEDIGPAFMVATLMETSRG